MISSWKDGSFSLTSVSSGKALALLKPGMPEDEVVQVSPDENSSLQRWFIRESDVKADFVLPKTSSKNDWENEKVFAVNKLPGHVTFIPYASDAEMISDHLYTAGQPDVDLLIRTSGEMRLSNFLLYQNAYAEFIFPKTLFPDFTVEEYDRCLQAFGRRDRRYGGRKG